MGTLTPLDHLQDIPPQTTQCLNLFLEACCSAPQAAWSFISFSVRLKSLQMDSKQFQVNELKYWYQQKEDAGFQLALTFSCNISSPLPFP